MSGRLPVEPIFDQTPHLFGDGPPDPVVYDASERALRQRTVNFAAKRYVDMMFVSGLDRATADRHFRPRAAARSGGPERASRWVWRCRTRLLAAHQGRSSDRSKPMPLRRRVTVTWNDPAFGDPVKGNAVAVSRLWRHCTGRASARRGSNREPSLGRPAMPDAPGRSATRWKSPPPAAMTAALDAFFASSPGIYGVLIGTPDRVLLERYSDFGARRSRDAELVDDQGDHLHADRTYDP